MTQFKLSCTGCGSQIEYLSRKGMVVGRRNSTMCASCRGRNPRRHDVGKTKWNRVCPVCNEIKYYSSKRNLKRAVETNSHCPKCHPGPSKATIRKIVKSLKEKKYPNRASNTKRGKELPFKRECPECNTILSYVSEYSRNRANKQNAICNSCSSSIYKKSWTYVIKDEHVQQMAATKAGYDSYTEYMKDLDSRKKYYREVRQLTKQQNLSVLENFDKIRGLCGVTNAYQLDHIIPVSVGYEQNISPTLIADIANLQIIPWKDNLLKSNNQLNHK